MIAAIALVAYALAVAVTLPRFLRGAAWTARAPRLAIAFWQAASVSIVGALVLAGLVLALPTASLAGGLAGVLHSCEMAIREAYASAGGLALTSTGMVLAGTVAARTMWCLTAALARASRLRTHHRAVLRMVGRPSAALRATIVDTPAAAAYCLPGRSRDIVLTTGALRALSNEQLDAVLAHEHAHLRGRHHLVIAASQALLNAFPRVPLFAIACGEIGRLLEMLADDAAARQSDRTMVATALVALADAQTPAAALAAGGPSALSRVRRLLAPADPLGRARTAGGFCLVAVALLAPILIAVAPAGAAIGMSWCSTPDSHTSSASAATTLSERAPA